MTLALEGRILVSMLIWMIHSANVVCSGDLPLVISTNGICSEGKTCLGSKFGSCCSKHDYCGSTQGHCSASSGCQLSYGTCTPDTATGIRTSLDGKCGSGLTCARSVFGKCCSSSGYCGSSPLYCSPSHGCQIDYGACLEAGAGVVSQNGQCGNGITCQNSGYGNCCSGYGWCGSTSAHCDGYNGCQPQFGTCQS